MESIARRVLQGFPLGAVFLNTLVSDLDKTDNKRVVTFADNIELFMIIETNIPLRSCRSVSDSWETGPQRDRWGWVLGNVK